MDVLEVHAELLQLLFLQVRPYPQSRCIFEIIIVRL